MVRFAHVTALGLVLAAIACGRTPIDRLGASAAGADGVEAHPRQPSFTPDDESYPYYEGSVVSNRCVQDRDCLVSGCSGSTCAAEAMVIADSDFCHARMLSQAAWPGLASCGCLAGECRWYFENDYDRSCAADPDCEGLGPPPGGVQAKARWKCTGGSCRYLGG